MRLGSSFLLKFFSEYYLGVPAQGGSAVGLSLQSLQNAGKGFSLAPLTQKK
jgi:hypothetical protein